MRKIKKIQPTEAAYIDFSMFWPPDEDNGSITVLAEVNREEVPWDFRLKRQDWSIPSDPVGSVPKDLLGDIRYLFEAAWDEVAMVVYIKHKGFFRLHDDAGSIDLASGKRILDKKRADFDAVNKLAPFKKKPATAARRSKDCPIKINQTIDEVIELLDTSAIPQKMVGQQSRLFESGIAVLLLKGRVRQIHCFPPFKESGFGGVSLGLHASQVQRTLGDPYHEEFVDGSLVVDRTKMHRTWHYPKAGLVISFNNKDCVGHIRHFKPESKVRKKK